jgi:S-adenosylmethionine/arginine decarboxylase-like enzyme
MSENTYWGHHLIINAAGCNPEAIKDHDTVYNFTKQLVKDIDMVAYGEPQIVNFGSGDKAGFTLVQLIETSNISAHFVNEYNEIYLDVFSCKHFDSHVVVDLVKEYFGATNVWYTFIDRKAPIA